MEPVIKVEHLSKKYLLRHQNTTGYATLRETIAGKARSIFSGSSLNSGSNTEEFMALNDISFEVKQGERVGIIGRNGAGKSTLLKILSRIVEPTKGRITIDGRVASLLEVGTGFHPELTGRENIFLNGSILGMSKAEIKSKFDEIVAFSEVEQFLDTPVKHYSSGMYVRLAFAVAAHLEPEILIVDEVLAVGDAAFQKKCLGKMKDVSGEGRTILFVSHNMAAVSSFCSTIIILKEGKLYGKGEADKMIKSYLNIGESGTGERTDGSPARKDAKLKIRSVKILNNEHLPASELNNASKGFVEIVFEILQEGRGYDVSLELSHKQYGAVFSTCFKDSDTAQNDHKTWQKGTYKYRIELPMNILRGGDYWISTSSAIPKIEVLDIFKFETTFFILDSISPVAKTTEGRSGAILPVIKWEETS